MNESPVERALCAMKNARYDYAISLFQARLAQKPDDLRSLLQLGFCHLLKHSEKAFLKIYKDARALKHRLGEISEDVRRLFGRYEGWVKRISATALIIGSVSAAACESSPKYDAPPYDEYDTVDPDAGDTASDIDTNLPFSNDVSAFEK